MAFVVYNSTTGKVESFARTQDIADARADADAALTAHQGDVTLPREIAGPLTAWFDATAVTLGEIPPVDDTPIERLKRAALEGSRQFWEVWDPNLDTVGPGFSSRNRNLGKDCLLGGFKGLYLTIVDSSVSIPLRISKIEQASMGASLITSPTTFYQFAGRLTIPSGFVAGDPIDWVIQNADNTAYERRALQVAIDSQQTDHPAAMVPSFDDVDLLGTEWIENLTA